jgi:hypothetical protein
MFPRETLKLVQNVGISLPLSKLEKIDRSDNKIKPIETSD